MSNFEEQSANPLLDRTGLPRFSEVRPEHVVPAVRMLLEQLGDELTKLEETAEPTWTGLVEPLDQIQESIVYPWGIVRHLMAVRSSNELRSAHEEVQPELVKFMLRLHQSKPLFERLTELKSKPEWSEYDRAQQRIVETLLRQAHESGGNLEGEQRERFNQIQLELAQLRTQFSNQLLDATKSYSLLLENPAEIDGLPQSALELAAQSAREAGHEKATAQEGPWRITLDMPSFRPFLQHARRRDLREKLYRASITKASSGDLDNTPLVTSTLRLRKEKAKLLGFEHFADLSLSAKMAGSVAEVEGLLEELRDVAHPAAQKDLADLESFAQQQGFPAELPFTHWDQVYWAERMREEKLQIRDESLRPYFPLSKVLEGLFDLCHRLFQVRIEAADGEADTWHEDVRFFRVYNRSNEEIAAFFLDPYSRPSEKRGGAWMDDCVGRSRLHAPPGRPVRLPVAYLICNQTPPVNGNPSLMTFDEVRTLFHEFGHGLHHMLTTVDYLPASGTNNVEWDAVELPSLFMENWCYHDRTLRELSGHFETGEDLPLELRQRIVAARNFMTGSGILRQLHFGLTDLALHSRFDPDGSATAFDLQREIAERTTVLPPLPEDRFLCSFSHIFAGAYAAGYYSYHWAQVLSADAFSAFEDAGLEDDAAVRTTGHRFRDTVLALGGSQPPLEIYRSFRGRNPTTRALLRHAGLTS